MGHEFQKVKTPAGVPRQEGWLMVRLVMGIGIGVASTVGLTVAVVSTMVTRVESVFSTDEDLVPITDDFAHLR